MADRQNDFYVYLYQYTDKLKYQVIVVLFQYMLAN